MSNAQDTRSNIAQLLRELHRPMTSAEIAEIAEMLHVHFGVDISTQSAGANLGYLRAAGLVDRRSCPKWGKPYFKNGKWNFSTENWWWHTEVVSKDAARTFVMRIRREVEMKLLDFQRGRGRPVTIRLPARTDDMRQMLIDLSTRVV